MSTGQNIASCTIDDLAKILVSQVHSGMVSLSELVDKLDEKYG